MLLAVVTGTYSSPLSKAERPLTRGHQTASGRQCGHIRKIQRNLVVIPDSIPYELYKFDKLCNLSDSFYPTSKTVTIIPPQKDLWENLIN